MRTGGRSDEVEAELVRFIDFIETAMAGNGVTRRQLADAVDVSSRTIRNWLDGTYIMPVERVDAVADAIGVGRADLLQRHPHSVAVKLEQPQGRFAPAEWLLGGTVAIVLLLLTGFLVWASSGVACFAVGAGSPERAPAFRAEYELAGGVDALGCATNEIHRWGNGNVQDLAGGTHGAGIIAQLDDGDPVVLAGAAWEAFVGVGGGASSDVFGLPAVRPVLCSDLIVYPLERGLLGPGAIVETADSEGFVVLAGVVWRLYADSGGPDGVYGKPISVTRSNDSITAVFENGEILDDFEGLPAAAVGLDRFRPLRCPPVSYAQAALVK